MAKDKNKAGGDDDWDSWDDDTSWDDGLEEEKDDRSPRTRFALGALKGAAKDLASIDRMKDLARKALPKGYGDAMDTVDAAVSSTRELYHDAVRELKPGVRQSKRYLSDLSKQYRDKVPKVGKKILDKWEAEAKEEDAQKARDRQYQEDQAAEKDRELLATVTEALEGNQEQQAQQHADNQARDDIRQDVEDKRYAQTSKQMSVMQEGVSKMVGFNNQFAARYMRKSLELKYRSLGLQRAQFDHAQQVSEITFKLLQGIQKNTGLPDFVKANASERVRDMAFRKMFGATMDQMGSFNQRFFGNIKENIGKRVVGRVKGELDNTQQLLSAMLAGRDMMSMTEGMGTEGDSREMQGEMAGGMLSSVVAPWLVGKGRDKLEKMAAKSPDSRLAKIMGSVKDNGANLSYGSRNLAKLIQLDLAEGHYSDDQGFLKNLARRGLNMVADRDHGRRFSVGTMKPEDLIQGAQFDNLTYRSINEVIPGYLAKILQSTEGIRTGEDDPDSHVFDNSTGSFISNRKRVSSAKEQLFKRSEFSGFAGSMSSVLKIADPEEKLSEKARGALTKQLMRDFDANIPYDPQRYIKLSNFDKSIDKEAAKEIAAFFRDRFGIVDDIDENGNRTQTIANKDQFMREREAADLKFGEAGRYQPDIQRQLNLLANTGDRDALRKIGILETKDGVDRVNHDRYFAELDRYIDNPDYEKRAFDSTDVERSKTRDQSAGDTVINKSGGKDPKNTAAIRELTRSLSGIESLRNGGAAEWGFGKWWNEQGIIATSIEEQARAWQEIQLEAQTRAEEQRTEMLAILREISQNGGVGGGAEGEEGEEEEEGYGRAGLLGKVWRSRRLRSGLRKGGGLLKRGVIGAARFAKNRFIGDVNRVIGAQRWMLDKLTGGARKLQDIYVKGENQPRLLAAKMKQGMYLDQESGSVIKTFKDIKGPVVDTDGNVVLTKDDFDKGLVNRWGKAVEQSGIREWAAQGRDTIMRLGNIPGMIKSVGKGVWDYLDRVKDVYVKGETSPRLLAMVMNNGGYFSKVTGKIIKRYTDIDGDVVDAQGNVVMTLADMQKGIVDKLGKPIMRAKDRLMAMAAKTVTLPLTAMRKAKDLLVGAGRGVKNALGRMGNWWKDSAGIGIAANLTMADRLEKIYELLQERLVDPNKKDYRDKDGDGVRDGSLEDLRAKREGKEGEGEVGKDGKPKEEGEKKPGMMGQLFEMLGNTKLGGLIKGLGGGAMGQMLGGLSSGAMGLGGAALGATKLLGRGALGLGKAALWAGRGALAVGSMGMSAVGGMAGLGALLFNPITLGILAGGAAIWGAWKLYKHFADKPDPMQLLRLYAYGARGDESDFNAKILKTETYLTEHTISTGGGSYAFDPQTDASELLKVWEIDAKDRDRLGEWLRWFQDRFTPVYIRAFKNWKEQFPDGKKFMEMDKEPDGIAKVQWSEAFIDQDQNPQGPYYVEACPLAGEDRKKYLSGPNVLGLMQKQLEVIRKKYSKQTVKLTQEQASGRWDQMSAAQRKAHAPYALDGQKAVRRFNNMDYKSGGAERRRIFDATAVVESISKNGKKTVTGGLIDELTSLRIRLYGLKVPLKSNIMVLLDLEDSVEPAMVTEGATTSFKGDLNKLYQEYAVKFGRAVNSPTDQKIWTEWMVNRFLPVFVELVAGANKYGAQGKLDDTLQMVKDDDRYLIAQAMAGATYKDAKGDKKSIWTWDACGFSGIPANTDSSSVLVQMDALKFLADKAKVREKTDKANKEKEDLSAAQQNALMQSAGYQKNADGTWTKKSKQAYGANPSNTYTGQGGVQKTAGGGAYDTGQEVQSSGSYGQIDTGGVSDGGFRTPARGPGADKGRKLLIKAAIARGITDPKELAMLLANVEHESGDYKYSRELTYTKPEALVRVFPKYFPTLAAAQAAISQGPAAVFERVYGGRMGNNKPGDGARYIGRGNIQITGKDNYLRIGKFLGKDLTANPEYLESPEGAAEGTVAWWMLNKRARDAAQSGDVDSTRRAVNGGLNGIQDVRQRTASWMMAIKSGQLQKLIDEAKGGGGSESTSANGDGDQVAPASPGDLTDIGYRSKVAAAATDVVNSAATPADLAKNAPVQTPNGMAPQPGKESASQKQAASAGAPLASTPPVSTTPVNPGANRGTAPTANPGQVESMARQAQSIGQPDGGVKSILEKQLIEQQEINKNTKKMADGMEGLVAAVSKLNLGGGSNAPAQSSQQLQSRPQGVSPMRSRHQ